MPDSAMYNTGRGISSFLNEEVDPEMQEWAEKTKKVKPGGYSEGSVFMEEVDPVTGEKKYIARRKDRMVGWDTQKDGGVATFKDKTATRTAKLMRDEYGNPMITDDREYGPEKLTRGKSWQYNKEFSDYKTDAAEQAKIAREEAKRMAEENRKSELTEKSKDRDVQRAVGARRDIAAVDREIAMADPDYEATRNLRSREAEARIKALEAAAEDAARERQSTLRDREQSDAARRSAVAYKPKTNAGNIVYKEMLDTTGDPIKARDAALEADRESMRRSGVARATSFIDDVTDFNRRDASYFGADPSGTEVEDMVGKAGELRNYYVSMGMDQQEANMAVINAFRSAASATKGDDMAEVLLRRLRETFGS
jgi:hypothetical protein